MQHRADDVHDVPLRRVTVTYEPGPDLTAHHQLVVAMFAQQWDGIPFDTHDLWDRAVFAQMDILGGWEAEARNVVERLALHLQHLATRAPWFHSNRELRQLAIEETIIYNAVGWGVTSETAQETWSKLWSVQMQQQAEMVATEPGAADPFAVAQAMRARAEGPQADAERLEADWKKAWDEWSKSN